MECFIYRADFYCDDCGKAICADLDQQGKRPSNPDDQHSYDSDEYPKAIGEIGESDCVHHCGAGEACINAIQIGNDGPKIGCWLENDLTGEGVDSLIETAATNPGKIVDLWIDLYGEAYGLTVHRCPHCDKRHIIVD